MSSSSRVFMSPLEQPLAQKSLTRLIMAAMAVLNFMASGGPGHRGHGHREGYPREEQAGEPDCEAGEVGIHSFLSEERKESKERLSYFFPKENVSKGAFRRSIRSVCILRGAGNAGQLPLNQRVGDGERLHPPLRQRNLGLVPPGILLGLKGLDGLPQLVEGGVDLTPPGVMLIDNRETAQDMETEKETNDAIPYIRLMVSRSLWRVESI